MERIAIQRQPKVLILSSVTMFTERFGYYILGFLLTLYMKYIYNVSDEAAFAVFSLFTALSYIVPAIGGYIADKFIGIKRCLGLGLLTEAIGYGLLGLPTQDKFIFCTALGAVIVGAGLFKTAPTNILGKAYEKGDPRIDSGFTLFYMAINVGSFLSSLVAGTLLDRCGFHVPFVIASISSFCGFIYFVIFKFMAKDYDSAVGNKHFSIFKWIFTLICTAIIVVLIGLILRNITYGDYLFYLLVAIIFGALIYEFVKCTKKEKIDLVACMVLICLGFCFFIIYYQLYTSIILFLKRNVDTHLGSWNIPVPYFLGLNGLWIIILSPIVASIYKALEKRKRDLPIMKKFPLGIFIASLTFVILFFACKYYYYGNGYQISWIWMIPVLFVYSLGELLTSALGVAVVTRMAPARLYGFMMGTWFVIASGFSALISGKMADWAKVPDALQHNPLASLQIYTNAFMYMAFFGIATAVIGFILAPWLQKMTHENNK